MVLGWDLFAAVRWLRLFSTICRRPSAGGGGQTASVCCGIFSVPIIIDHDLSPPLQLGQKYDWQQLGIFNPFVLGDDFSHIAGTRFQGIRYVELYRGVSFGRGERGE